MWAAHQAGLACLARCLVPVLLTVTVCITFARWLGKSARELEDRSHTGLAVGVRGRLRRARRFVMDHRWHDHPVIGRPLRWIGKHTA